MTTRCIRVCTALLLLAPAAIHAQTNNSLTGRWVGGLVLGDDYTAVVIRLGSGSKASGTTVTYPNQRRVLGFDHVTRHGTHLTLSSKERDELWEGDVVGDALRGRFRDAQDTARFELVRAPDIAPERLRTLAGTYRWSDGRRIRIAVLARPTDELLTYFDESTGEERWLFPDGDSGFVAGPTFEAPRPITRKVIFTRGARGRTQALRWWRDSAEPVDAVRSPFVADSVALGATIREFMQRRNVPSVAVGVVTRDGMMWGAAYGEADRERHRAATLTTPYQIGSVTKTFTATLLMSLRDEGLLQLDDPLARYLPPSAALPNPGDRGESPVTLRTLLTHTSGLPGDPVNRVDVDGVMRAFSTQDLLDGLPRTFLGSPVGSQWSYSNLGYGLLGYVIERVAHRPYEDVLRQRLLGPLDMHDTGIHLSNEMVARLAVPYWPEDSIRVPRPRWVFGQVAAFGGLTSTVPDLARFVALQLRAGEPFTSPVRSGSLAEMQRVQYARQGGTSAMGLAWWISRDPLLGTILYHGGEVDGFSSYVAFSRIHGVGVILLTNLGGSTADDLGRSILADVIGSIRQQQLPGRDEAFSLFLDGDWAAAEWALADVAKSRKDDGVAWLRLGIARFRLDRFGAAQDAFERAAALSFLPEQAMMYLARIHALHGEREEAVAWIERAWKAGFRSIDQMRGWPELETVLDDPRVRALSK
jgi:D-alanyl-D-alanine-carboxypeptidase/D-alanyl-D-alanine-endopeptidase